MDETLRELERKAATGDNEAKRRLQAAKQRSQLRFICNSGDNMLTDLMGCRVRYARQVAPPRIIGDEPHSDPHFNKEGRVVSVYIPTVAAGSYGKTGRLQLVVELDNGILVDEPTEFWQVLK